MTSEKIWTIPYIDQPISFWLDLFEKYEKYIDEVYFPLPLDTMPSGRPLQPTQHLQDFLEKSPFTLSALVNPIIFLQPIEDIAQNIIEKLKQLYEEFNLHSVTISNLMLAEKIKQSIPGLKLTASVLMDIFSSNQVAMIDEIFDVLVPSSRILRNLTALRSLKDSFRGQIRLIVNEGCLPNCIFRAQHFFEMGAKIAYPKSLCEELLTKKPWLRLTGSWILPQHLHFYTGLYDKLKLAGRVTLQNPSYYREVLDAYVFRKKRLPHKIGGGPAAPREPIEIRDDFFKHTLVCDWDCIACNCCLDYYRLKIFK